MGSPNRRTLLYAALFFVALRLAAADDDLCSGLCPAQAGITLGPPVCSLAGLYFPNPCLMRCARMALRGECGQRSATECKTACAAAAVPPPPRKPDIFCMAQEQPVCDKLGRAYSNSCEADARGVTDPMPCKEATAAACTKWCFEQAGGGAGTTDPPTDPITPCGCDRTVAPVCGKSGAVHDNKCLADCKTDPVNFVCKPVTDINMIGIPGLPIVNDLLPPGRIGGVVDKLACQAQCLADAGLVPKCEEGCKLIAPSDNNPPVCGQSGKVYDNACLALCATDPPKTKCDPSLSVDKCSEQCACQHECSMRQTFAAEPPVCGESGQWWPSDCERQCTGDPKCDASVFAPLCSVDGTVVRNACLAKCDGTAINEEVKCSTNEADLPDCQDACKKAAGDGCAQRCKPLGYWPVCGADGSVYDNWCFLQCAGVEPNKRVLCLPIAGDASKCQEACKAGVPPDPCAQCDTKEYTPICDVDGNFYKSACLAKCVYASINSEASQQCSNDPEEEKACREICAANAGGDGGPDPPFPCDCTGEPSDPVCTYLGKVFDNECEANCARLTVSRKCSDDPEGDCVETCAADAIDNDGGGCMCDMMLDEVCATDGLIYPNKCTLECKEGRSGGITATMTRASSFWPGTTPTFAFSCIGADGQRDPDCEDKCKKAAESTDKCRVCSMIKMMSMPVCGMSGTVHDSICWVNCKQDRVRWPCRDRLDCAGDCLAAKEADEVLPGGCNDCIDMDMPVCAASGTVQPNTCSSVCAGDDVWFECSKLTTAQCTAACSAALAVLPPRADLMYGKASALSCSCNGKPVSPVCATSGTVYNNQCLLTCRKATKLRDCKKGENCPVECMKAATSKMSPKLCKKGSAPVCATNGQVLPSMCALQAAKLTKRWDCLKRKNCAKDCKAAVKPTKVVVCPKAGRAVCGKAGTKAAVYANDCLRQKANAKKLFDCGGRFNCKADCSVAVGPKKFCNCKPHFKPICAKNGSVFTNACLAKCAKQKARWPCGRRGAACPKQCSALKGKP